MPEESNNTQVPESTTVIARLIETSSFNRGNFTVLTPIGAGIVLHDVRFAASDKKDRGNLPKPGTLYQISGYPVEGGGDATIVDSPATKQKMIAIQTASKKDEITEVEGSPPRNLMHMLKGLAKSLTEWKDYEPGGKPPGCLKAPATLQDAIKRVKSLGNQGNQKVLPATGGSVRNEETGQNIFDGLYMEHNDEGDFSITAGGKGLVIDKKGTIYQEGKVVQKQSSISRPHALGGIPTKLNDMDDIMPKQIFTPTLSRLPDLSILNWAIKIFLAFDKVKDIFEVKFKKEKWWETKVQLTDDFGKMFNDYKKEQSENSVKGKIV